MPYKFVLRIFSFNNGMQDMEECGVKILFITRDAAAEQTILRGQSQI